MSITLLSRRIPDSDGRVPASKQVQRHDSVGSHGILTAVPGLRPIVAATRGGYMSLVTTEIARGDWSRALAELSSTHEGWLASWDILAMEFGAQREVTDLPLVGLTFEPRGTGTITVAAERPSGDHLTHTIEAPSRVWIERGSNGGDAFLEIESEDGSKTLFRLRPAA
jgi:hypothetical protein